MLAPIAVSIDPKLVSAGIVADRGDEIAPRPDRAHVLRDVARAAQGEAPLANAYDRDGRFGRDALDVAVEVDVEHRVADHGDARVRRRTEAEQRGGRGTTSGA